MNNTPHQLPAISERPRPHDEPPRRPDDERERTGAEEPAARKVDVDEDYDVDDVDDVKRSGQNGHLIASSGGEKKTPPNGANASNGLPVGQPNEP